MDTEELNESSSWIPTIALRNAADIKSIIKPSLHKKSSSLLPNGASINLNISQKPSHQRFNTASISQSSPKGLEASLGSKYLSTITRLNEEVAILSEQLKEANSLISELSDRLNDTNSKHALHLQALQERHEQKMKRNQQEIEFLLKSSKKTKQAEIEQLESHSKAELEKQKDLYSKKIKKCENEFYEELEKREFDYQTQLALQKNHFFEVLVNVRDRFTEELERFQSKYKRKISKLKKMQKFEKKCYEDASTLLEIDGERSKNIDQTLEEGGISFLDKKLPLKIQTYRDIDESILNLLKQLK